jgi:hypothetical protein
MAKSQPVVARPMAARSIALCALLGLVVALPALSTVPALGGSDKAQAPFELVGPASVDDRPESLSGAAGALDATTLHDVLSPDRVFAHDTGGALGTIPPEYGSTFEFTISHMGVSGPEPSAAVDSAGNIYFQAFINTLRSSNDGETWDFITPLTASVTTYDPYLWLDPDTDRLFNDQLLPLLPVVSCSWATWTDTPGADPATTVWDMNAHFCSTTPETNFVDHQKVHTGKIPPGHALASVGPIGYPNAVFFAWNDGLSGNMAMSVDGGHTFPFQATTVGGTCNGGLHGRPRSFSDGTLIVPKRDCNRPLAVTSSDFLVWNSVPVGPSAGSTEHRKNPDVAIDAADNAYMFWSGADEGTWMSFSADKGLTWSPAVRASPPNVLSTTFQAGVAGDPGKVAVMYYGNDHTAGAPDHVRGTKWHAYISMSLNALDPNPVWVTFQLDTEADPIQIGSISTNSHHAESGSRNLLDFNDLVLTPDGRIVAAYADGCTTRTIAGAACANNPLATSANSRDADGVAAVLQVGPRLVG